MKYSPLVSSSTGLQNAQSCLSWDIGLKKRGKTSCFTEITPWQGKEILLSKTRSLQCVGDIKTQQHDVRQRSTRTKEDGVISGSHFDWLTYYGMICEQSPLGHLLFDFLLVFCLIKQPMCSSSQVWGHGFTNGFYWPQKMKRSLSIAKPRETIFCFLAVRLYQRLQWL